MDGDSRWLSNCAELKHLNRVHVSTTHDILSIKFGAVPFVRRQYLRTCLLLSSYPYIVCTTFRNKWYTTFFSVWVFYEMILRIVYGIKTINHSFRLNTNYIMLKYLQNMQAGQPTSNPNRGGRVWFHSASTAKGVYTPPDHGYLKQITKICTC